MGGFTGKTYSILERLAHFYHASEAGPLLVGVVDLFGRRLESAETDLYQVRRSHHVETAENRGFQGYTAPPAERGDLDKIITLYLEALGGTSLLVTTNPRFTSRSFDARRLAARLADTADPVAAYLLDRGSTDAVRDLLRRYRVDNALIGVDEITPAFVLALLLGARDDLAGYIRSRLPAAAQKLLAAYDGGPALDPQLPLALSAGMNATVLRDPGLFRSNRSLFPVESLPDAAAQLVRSVYNGPLRAEYSLEPNLDLRQQLLLLVDSAEPAQTPVGDDQVRLNRMLLEAAYPEHLAARNIPALRDVRAAILQILNALLDVPDLYDARFLPDIEDYPALLKQYPDDPVTVNRILLESVFQSDIEKSYAPYRERLLGLIGVLRRGASTRQGILDIVCANLGIIGNDPEVRAARSTISVEEFSPERAQFFDGNVSLFETFDVNNTKTVDANPDIWTTMLDVPFGLANLRFVDLTSGRSVQVSEVIRPKALGPQQPDTLTIQGSAAFLNSVPIAPPKGGMPALHPGVSTWRFEADLFAEGAIRPAGRFDETAFDVSAWTPGSVVAHIQVLSFVPIPGVFTVVIPWHIPGFTDKFFEDRDHPRNQILNLVNRVRAAGVQAHVAYRQIFTEDHNLRDALGAKISGDPVHGYLLAEVHDMSDTLRASNTQTNREVHDGSDSLVLAGQFDGTRFDSLNTFAR